MQVNNFKIDTELLSKEMKGNFDNIVNVNLGTAIEITNEELFEYIQKSINSMFKTSKQKYYNIDNIESVFEYLFRNYGNIFKDNVSSHIDLVLISTIATALFLSKTSAQSNMLIHTILDNLEEVSPHINSIIPYLESSDLRGLIYWAITTLSTLDYDDTSSNISYSYAPPKVTPEWLNKYRKPEQPMEFWFYNSANGNALFLILYTPKCRYAKCSGCNLPSLSSQEKTTSPSAVYKQVDYVLKESISTGEKKSIKEVILSNNGNLFDIKTMPTLSLLYTINTLIEELPHLKKIIIESRIEYLNEHQLKTIEEVLSAHEDRNIKIEVALGFEIFDDEIRNGYYNKGFYKSALEKLMPLFAKYNISLKFYMMYKAVPQMTTQDAIIDINNVSEYAKTLVETYQVDINIHISPTYVAVGTQLEKEFNKGNFTPPGPKEIAMLCDELTLHGNVSYYISLNDEGLSSTHLEDEYKLFLNLKNKIDYFNSYQNWE
jgi:radical SAM enzyme (TIGR01210 family)